jgi:uncharacterized protein
VSELPRQPGSRENRWMHLLSGPPAVQEPLRSASSRESVDIGPGELAALRAQVTRLEDEVGELKTLVTRICTELGMKP